MGTTTPDIGDARAVGTRFLDALARQDWVGLEACFDVDVQFRALIPPGLREAADRTSSAGYLRRWFSDASELQLVSSEIKPVQGRLSIGYRFRALEDQWYIVEQHAYCDVADGHIKRMDLLCSGFRPQADSTQC